MHERVRVCVCKHACIYFKIHLAEHVKHNLLCYTIPNAGLCTFASDVYSAGVTLIELWSGVIWEGAETRGEGIDGMRSEVLVSLAKIKKTEPKVAKILRKCVAERAAERPSPSRLLRMLQQLQQRKSEQQLPADTACV
jgi:hypothetical protein